MSIFIYLIGIFLGVFKKRNKYVTLFLFLTIIAMSAGARNLADSPVYYNRYIYTNYYSSFTELIFSKIIEISKRMNLNFDGFLVLMSFACFVPRIVLFKKISKQVNYVLALYLLFPIYLDVCWLRMTVGVTFVYIGFYLWFIHKESNPKYALICYAVGVLIGSGFHAALLTYFILIIPEYFSFKQISIVAVAIGGLCQFIVHNNRLYSMISWVVSQEKANIIQSTSLYGTINKWLIYTVLCMLLLFLVTEINLKHTLKNIRKYSKRETTEILENLIDPERYVIYLRKINVLMLVLIPFVAYAGSFYRIQLYMVPLMFIAFSYNPVINTRGSITKKGLMSCAITLIGFWGVLYFYILKTSIFETVFIPFFKENALLGF